LHEERADLMEKVFSSLAEWQFCTEKSLK